MKKITHISEKLTNNNFSYTGKGGFEAVVNKYETDILQWLEQLIPLQKQIDMLYDKENVVFQKRNYIRILTKYFPTQYKEFVNINILLRDSKIIQDSFSKQQDVTNLYNLLIINGHLKYPGRSENYVDFDTFDQFIKLYCDELNIEYISIERQKENIATHTKIENEQEQKPEPITQPIYNEPTQEVVQEVKKSKEENYWTNLLLGKK